jgi:hypothetical protein
MKTILIGTAILLGSQAGAQSVATHSNLNIKKSGYNTMVNVVDNAGKPFEPDMSVQGSPFLTEDWRKANLALANGSTYGDVKVRLNLHQSTLHFLNAKGVEMYLEASEISRVELLDSSGKLVQQVFVKMTQPLKNGAQEHQLYQVLAEGKINLLKQMRKKVQVYIHEYSKEITRSFEQYESYFVFGKNELQALKRKASFWEPLMQDNWKAVSAFANANGLDFKSVEDITKLVAHYNGL